MRVVIADDEVLIQHGLVTLLEQQGFGVAAAVSDAKQLRTAVQNLAPDLVITDIRMPPNFRDEGLHEAIYLKEKYPALGVVVLSQHVQRRHAARLIADSHAEGAARDAAGFRRAGVGYLLKQRVGQVASFCEDLRRVAAGATVLDPEVLVLTEGAVVKHISGVYSALQLADTSDAHRRVQAVARFLSQ